MFKILFILLIIKIALGDDESYEKYIDLLPEEEKQEFLNRIARRILEGIKKNELSDPDQPNVEMSDAQLEAHDSYVKDILKEETERLESEKREDFEKDEGEEDKGREVYIDLTLREGKRSKRKNNDQTLEVQATSEIPYKVIPVKTIYDDFNDDPSNITNSKIKDDNETSIKQDINDPSILSESNNDLPIQSITDDLISQTGDNTINDKSLRKSIQNDTLTNDATKDSDGNVDDGITTDDYNVINESVFPKSEETTNTIASEVTEISTISANEDELNKDPATESIQDTTTVATNTATTISSTDFDNTKDTDLTETTTLTIQEDEATENDLSEMNQKLKSSEVDYTTIATRRTTANLNHTNIDNPKQNVVNNIEITENYTENINNTINLVSKREDTEVTTIANKKNKIQDVHFESKIDLHLRLGDVGEPRKDVMWIKGTDTKQHKEKEYKVYEVDADNPPFRLANKDETTQQKHYVPIYDYNPENAYFRPYDRFGPNSDIKQDHLEDSNSNEESKIKNENDFNIKDNIFSGYKNKDNKIRIKSPIENVNTKGFPKPIHTHVVSNQYYNTYDKVDMEYENDNDRYVLRSQKTSNEKLFPDSNDSDHPYNSIHRSDTIKDHVRAVRNLLYIQKDIGYIPEVEKEVRKFDTKTETQLIKKIFDYDYIDDKIAMDYYYDRLNSLEDSGILTREKSSQTKLFVLKKLLENFNAYLDKNAQHLKRHKYKRVDKTKFSSFFDAIVEVLGDMIRFDNTDLVEYDWLKTSVDVQSAVQKLLDLTETLRNGKKIHPKDLELLKYCLYLFKSSKATLKRYIRTNKIDDTSYKRKKKIGLLPRNRNRNRIKHLKLMWKNLATYIRGNDYGEQNLKILYDFEDFLYNILFHLNELHNAIKHVAMITKFNDQNWFRDLKQIYLKNPTRKELGNLLLHFSVFDLLDRLEADASDISKVNFRIFVENNPETVRNTRNDFVFVLSVLDELNRINV